MSLQMLRLILRRRSEPLAFIARICRDVLSVPAIRVDPVGDRLGKPLHEHTRRGLGRVRPSRYAGLRNRDRYGDSGRKRRCVIVSIMAQRRLARLQHRGGRVRRQLRAMSRRLTFARRPPTWRACRTPRQAGVGCNRRGRVCLVDREGNGRRRGAECLRVAAPTTHAPEDDRSENSKGGDTSDHSTRNHPRVGALRRRLRRCRTICRPW